MLSNHIVDLNPIVQAPTYVQDNPFMDISSLVSPEAAEELMPDGSKLKDKLENVNVLMAFPSIPQSGMDDSQMGALQNMLTKKIAIVQGPPGTGKISLLPLFLFWPWLLLP